jgi:exopolyphosphatase / guanosine-5'-triphosphate,3'-diphosphate pyrophosphatase
MRLAIIDLGSNTFHVLITDVGENGVFNEVYKKRIFVGLGEGGIDFLKTEAIKRGLDAATIFKSILDEYQPYKTIITGTAALRNAANAIDFIEPAQIIFGQNISIIDGDKEAKFIFEGIKLLSKMEEPTLIMDIGGGSTEFILVKNGELIWAESYKLGIGVLHPLFHLQEPISQQNIELCKKHILKVVQPLVAQLQNIRVETMIGASGTFEIFESMSGKKNIRNQANYIDKQVVLDIINKVVIASDEERMKMEGLPNERVGLIVVALVLVDTILELVNPDQMIISPYALKEGVLASMLEPTKKNILI